MLGTTIDFAELLEPFQGPQIGLMTFRNIPGGRNESISIAPDAGLPLEGAPASLLFNFMILRIVFIDVATVGARNRI